MILLHSMSTFSSPELVKRRAQEHFVRDTWKEAAGVGGCSLVDSSFEMFAVTATVLCFHCYKT